jgi:hypothetical protein
MMRRTILSVTTVALALVFVASPASGSVPVHERFEVSGTFDPGSSDPELNPYGVPDMCTFDYVQSWDGIANVTTWGDPASFDKQIWNGPIVVTHTNATDGVVLTEKASYTVILEDFNGEYPATDTEAGLYWHLRDADGKVVVVKAGRIAWDNVEGTVTYTPNTSVDFWALVCPALGGEVAG